jgi:predicted nucleotidyltransferase
VRAGRPLAPQHERLIERAHTRFSSDPDVVALLVGGSIAHGYALPDSDVDVMVVVAAEPPERTFASADLADYDGGYLDAKLVTRAFVEDVAQRGSEPARWAFKDALVVFSHDPQLPALVERAACFPEDGRDERLRTFLRYLLIHVWFMGEADKRGDRYLATYAAQRVCLFAGRAILAHNRMLYPFHKWFLRELAQAPDRPDGLLDAIDLVLVHPTKPHAERLASSVAEFCGIDVSGQRVAEEFLERTEWAWRRDAASPEDW